MTTHLLKTWPQFFQPIIDGDKRAEVRQDDRGVVVGDTLRLEEWQPDNPEFRSGGHYTGRAVDVRVTHILRGRPLPDGLAVLSFEVTR